MHRYNSPLLLGLLTPSDLLALRGTPTDIPKIKFLKKKRVRACVKKAGKTPRLNTGVSKIPRIRLGLTSARNNDLPGMKELGRGLDNVEVPSRQSKPQTEVSEKLHSSSTALLKKGGTKPCEVREKKSCRNRQRLEHKKQYFFSPG